MLVILINVVHVAAYLEKLGWLAGDELEASEFHPIGLCADTPTYAQLIWEKSQQPDVEVGLHNFGRSVIFRTFPDV